MKCDRCGRDVIAYMMSFFNEDKCCLACLDKERKHPRFKLAHAAEVAACERGDFNFPGVGKPADL